VKVFPQRIGNGHREPRGIVEDPLGHGDLLRERQARRTLAAQT
jgi:hypothetical protein